MARPVKKLANLASRDTIAYECCPKFTRKGGAKRRKPTLSTDGARDAVHRGGAPTPSTDG